MPLSYLRDDYHKQAVTHIWESRRFKLMCTLQGKTRPTRHKLSTLSPRMVWDHTYLTWSTYSNLSRSHQQSWAGPLLPRKRTPDTIHSTPSWPIRGSVPSFSPKPTNEEVEAKSSICWRRLLGLLGLWTPACDRYVQYLLAGGQPIGT
jgi:hypothetical protein